MPVVSKHFHFRNVFLLNYNFIFWFPCFDFLQSLGLSMLVLPCIFSVFAIFSPISFFLFLIFFKF